MQLKYLNIFVHYFLVIHFIKSHCFSSKLYFLHLHNFCVFLFFRQLYPDKISELEKLSLDLQQSSDQLAPLKVWQFQELSLQAAQRIVTAPREEALSVLTHIAQNFPMQVST